MDIAGEIVMPSDVILQPVNRLPPEAIKHLQFQEGDYSLTRPRSRIPSSIVDARTAGLLEIFRTPMTIVDAVITYSRTEKLDPNETLESAFPILRRFFNAGLLLAADSHAAKPIETTNTRGSLVGSLQLLEPVYLMLDTEVYLARATDGSLAAVKIARAGAESKLRAQLAHEAVMLNRLDGKVNPRLIEQGEVDGRPFLAVSWCRGVDAYEATAEARARGREGQAELLVAAARIAEAYAHLHDQGILHGDVHPRNIVVDENKAVTLIDFGLAAPIALNASPITGRGCIDLFMDPELAQAHLLGHSPPAASSFSEQYSVAALLYLLVTGAHTHNFVLEAGQMQRQVAEEPPIAFNSHGVNDLPHFEEVLRRALNKDPALRFRTMSEFFIQLSRAATSVKVRQAKLVPPRHPRECQRLLGEILDRLALSGPLLDTQLEAPTSSVRNGAAGFAYALFRVACIREDEKLLALADVWSNKAMQNVISSRKEAFWSVKLGITEETTGNRSFHHTASGVHCVDALVAKARGDDASCRRAVNAFLATSCRPWSHFDVSFGRAGNLLGCASLFEATTTESPADATGLRLLGDELFSEIWRELEAAPSIGEASALLSLGVAHGWAGILYAVLRWSECSGARLPTRLGERLEELAALAIPVGRGLRWPAEAGSNHSGGALQASWCNGAAGFVHLWTAAHRLLGGYNFARMATGAAWTAFEAPHSTGDLCCGLAGRSYALLNLYKHTRDRVWLDRARDLAESAAASVRASSLRSDSLYQGRVGVGLLAADLECPEQSCMPLFESEDWTEATKTSNRLRKEWIAR
jgi:serine/threonine protein kinase